MYFFRASFYADLAADPLILFGHPSNASTVPHNPAAAPSNPDSAAAGKTYILFEGMTLESVLLTRRGAAKP